MRVKELIAQLEKMPQDAKVVTLVNLDWDSRGYMEAFKAHYTEEDLYIIGDPMEDTAKEYVVSIS